MKKETINWKIRTKNILILVFIICSLLLSFIPFNQDNALTDDTNSANIQNESLMDEIDNPKLSLPTSNYEWWNKSWNFRIPVDITSTGDLGQEDAPVELFINFTENFNDIGVNNPWLDKYSIRVIEYTSISEYTEIDCQFDWYNSYDNETNAIGDVIWILNGTTLARAVREFFIYFNNGSVSEVPYIENNIRLWHEGFEEYQIGDIISAGGSQDYHSDRWKISNTTSSRGQSSLRIWGDCWKAEYTGVSFDSNPDVRVTAKMRFDDPQNVREICGLGFHDIPGSIPAPGESYEISGDQDWGTAGTGDEDYDDQYYAASTFFWYTMSVISHDQYIFYIADDDDYDDRDLYWDDISVWSQVVNTVPDDMLTINTGDIEAISFTLKVIANDEFGVGVPNAQVFISNNSDSSINQTHATNEDGEWIFTELIKDGFYNITINYTQNGLETPETETVYYYENFEIATLSNVLIAALNLTTMYFNISDTDGDPIQYGHVIIKKSGTDVGKGTLNEIGNTTLRWINGSSYTYEVYYDFETRPESATYVDPVLEIVGNTLVLQRFINKPTNISKVYLNVTEATTGNPFAYAIVRLANDTGTYPSGGSIANITIGADGLATFVYFGDNQGNWGDYELDVFFAELVRTISGDGWGPDDHYDFKLDTKFNLNISVDMTDRASYNTTIDVSYSTPETTWGGNITVTFNFTQHTPSINQPVTPEEIYFQILDEEDGEFSSKISIANYEILPGMFNYTFNTTQYSLIGGTTYKIALTGRYKSYVPAEKKVSIDISGIATGISIHDYDPPHSEVSTVSQYFGESINVTIQYFNNETSAPLDGATVTYQWLSFDYMVVNPDPINIGYYTFLINTGTSGTATPRIMTISAKLENYTSQETTFILNILPRPTSINNQTDPLDRTVNIYIQDALNFTYEYRDILKNNEILGDLDQAYYKWYELSSGGGILQGPSGVIQLLERDDKVHVLDFSTDTKAVGFYLLRVTLVKTNYETKTQDITLRVLRRTIDVDIDAKGLDDDQLNIVKGKTVTIEITLTDPTQGDIPITGADVVLDIGGKEFDFDEKDDGVYELEFSTEDYEAFFNSETLTGEIIIKKANYETEEDDITIVIDMEEITEGVPTFYFIMVVAAIAAIVGSLGAYRYIQIARIPTFVKKARKVKKSIKSGDKISETLLYPSKEAYIAKTLGPKYGALGLSLDDLMGLKGKEKSEDTLKKNGGVK